MTTALFAPEGGGCVHPRFIEMTPTTQMCSSAWYEQAAPVKHACRLRSTPALSKPARQPSTLSRRRRSSPLIAVTLMLGYPPQSLAQIKQKHLKNEMQRPLYTNPH
jgi:hypothetical protein